MDLASYIKKRELCVRVRTRCVKTEVLGFDESHDAVVVGVKAVPEKGKANEELVRFLSKKLKKKVVLKSGGRSRTKILLVG